MPDITFMDDVYVQLIDKMGDDDSIIQAARVSTKGASTPQQDRDRKVNEIIQAQHFTDMNTANTVALQEITNSEKSDRGLINYLMRDRHGSPFEHCLVKVYVKAPLFVFREWQRHRIASYNEMSGRYTELLPEFYLPKSDRPLHQVGKPGAYTFEPGTEEQQLLVALEVRKSSEEAWKSYQSMLEAGVAKEVARIVLPLNIYSQMYTTINLRSLMNFLSLRTKGKENSTFPSFPQHEISLGADKLEEILEENFPWTYEAWNRNGRVAP